MKKRWLMVAAVPALLVCIYLLGLMWVQRGLVDNAHNWVGGRIENGPYVLETFRRDEGGVACASFQVPDSVSGEILYICPDAYRTMDLKEIKWMESDSVAVVSGDVGTILYSHQTDTWGKTP